MEENTKVFIIYALLVLGIFGLAGYFGTKEGVEKDLIRSTYSRAYFEGAETGVKLGKDTNSTIVDFRESFYTDSINFEKLIK